VDAAFLWLLETAVVNAYIIYRTSNDSAIRVDHKDFRVQLATDLVAEGVPAP
jgi:hypothetical protein